MIRRPPSSTLFPYPTLFRSERSNTVTWTVELCAALDFDSLFFEHRWLLRNLAGPMCGISIHCLCRRVNVLVGRKTKAHFKTMHRFLSDSRGTLLSLWPLGESGFQARRAAMRFAKWCNSHHRKAPPGRYRVRPLRRVVMLVTRTPTVTVAQDLGFEMRSHGLETTSSLVGRATRQARQWANDCGAVACELLRPWERRRAPSDRQIRRDRRFPGCAIRVPATSRWLHQSSHSWKVVAERTADPTRPGRPSRSGLRR